MDIGSACLKTSDKKLQPLNATMREEIRRLETFRHWPKPHIVSPKALAEAGLYYLNRDDYVQCAFCLGIIHNWIDGDNAMEEHRRLYPNCCFVKRIAYRYKCVKCLQSDVDIVFIPCLHINTCHKCSDKMSNCIVCNQGIKSTLKVRFSHEKETILSSTLEQCDSA